MRTRLVSTVGTSILSNFSSKAEWSKDSGISEEEFTRLKQLVADKNWPQFTKGFSALQQSARLCGAEINSINEVIGREKLIPKFIHFLVSDTSDGKVVGKILEDYLISWGIEHLQDIKIHTIEKLADGSPKDFRVHGLRNLARELGLIVRSFGADDILIDATGGYKAQIAVAVVFGQALGIPVLYRHERFSEIIEFPPMPITFDYAVLGENADLLATFEAGEALTQTEIESLDERVRVLLEEVDVDGETLYAMGAIGQILLDGFRYRFPRSKHLEPVSEKARASFRDDHYPSGFTQYVNKLIDDVPWIKTAHSLPYHKQASIKGNGAYVYEGKLVGTYKHDDFGARFEILTAATDPDQLVWAADQLNQYIKENKL